MVSSDYPKEFQKLVDSLSLSLNNGIELLYQTLSGEVTLRDNIKCTVKDILVKVDSSGNPLQTTAFVLKTTAKVDLVMCGLAQNQDNTAHFPTSGIFISGAQTSNIYTISNITGLQANEQYLLRVVAYQI